jgi:hypothetical protein
MPDEITCLFCFSRFPPEQALFRCTNPACPDLTPDPVYGSFEGLPGIGPMGRVFPTPPPARSLLGRAAPVLAADCPTCGRTTQKRICPVCHHELQHDAGMVDEKIIAIIGARSAGKSSYIAALVRRLRSEVGMNFGTSLTAANEHTRLRYRQDFEEPLFRDHRVLEATPPAGLEARTKTPLVFRLTFNTGRRRSRVASLVLFDTAGEDMQSLDAMSTEARYICHADALIFLLDPLQIDTVRALLPAANLPVRDPSAEPLHIVERLRELYERSGGLRPGQKIDRPVAFTLSKIDTLYPIIDPGSALFRTGEHFGYLNLRDVETVHTEIYNYLQAWSGPAFNNTVSSNFRVFRYFGVSALGQAPERGSIQTIASLRVEDPALWLLYLFGQITGKKP